MGINEKGSETVADLQRQFAHTLREELLHGRISIRDSRWPDRMARILAAILETKFDVLPKGELRQEWAAAYPNDDFITGDEDFVKDEIDNFGGTLVCRWTSGWKPADQS
jgi:hypothetical protein